MEETDASLRLQHVWTGLAPARRVRRQTYAVPQATIGPGVDDSELVIPGGYASLGRRSRDRSLTPEPCGQGLGDERREPDQSALFDAEADRYLQCQEPQGRLDDPSQRLWGCWQILL